MIATGLLGGHAWNSAHTVVEAACLECSMLLSHDPELLEISYAGLKKFLEKFDRNSLWITTPGAILRQTGSAKV